MDLSISQAATHGAGTLGGHTAPVVRFIPIKKNPHKATHGQGEADLSATLRIANPASRSDTGLGGCKFVSYATSPSPPTPKLYLPTGATRRPWFV